MIHTAKHSAKIYLAPQVTERIPLLLNLHSPPFLHLSLLECKLSVHSGTVSGILGPVPGPVFDILVLNSLKTGFLKKPGPWPAYSPMKVWPFYVLLKLSRYKMKVALEVKAFFKRYLTKTEVNSAAVLLSILLSSVYVADKKNIPSIVWYLYGLYLGTTGVQWPTMKI